LRTLLIHLPRQFSKGLRALAVKGQRDFPSLRAKAGPRADDVAAHQIGLLFDQELSRDRLAAPLFRVGHDLIPHRRRHLAGLDHLHVGLAIRIDDMELQLGHLLQLLAGVRDLALIQPGNLHQNAIRPLRRNDRLAHAKAIDPLPNRFHRLVHHVLGDGLLFVIHVGRIQPDQKRSAALQIEPEMDLAKLDHLPVGVLHIKRRIGQRQAEGHDEHGEHRAEHTLRGLAIGKKIPAEEHHQKQAKEKCLDVRVHRKKGMRGLRG